MADTEHLDCLALVVGLAQYSLECCFLKDPDMDANSPTISIYGSFFPVWLFAALAGLAIALLVRELLIASGMLRYLPAPAIFNLSVAVLSGVGLYVCWIGGYQ